MSTEKDKDYFLSIKDKLNPPFQDGERIVVSNGTYTRFKCASEAARYIITTLKKDCYVYDGDKKGITEL